MFHQLLQILSKMNLSTSPLNFNETTIYSSNQIKIAVSWNSDYPNCCANARQLMSFLLASFAFAFSILAFILRLLFVLALMVLPRSISLPLSQGRRPWLKIHPFAHCASIDPIQLKAPSTAELHELLWLTCSCYRRPPSADVKLKKSSPFCARQSFFRSR